jgi:hypothetical protein
MVKHGLTVPSSPATVGGPTTSTACDLGQGELRRGLGRRCSHSRPVSPTLNGFQGSRAMLFAHRLNRSPPGHGA